VSGLYFNEIDPFACAVLREAHGGFVDQRSIKEVNPDDVRGYERAHFFAGAGLWEIAADMAGKPREGRPVIDWEAIEREFRAGQLSVVEIGRQHGLSHTAINKRAKRDGWTRNLADKVRKAVSARRPAGKKSVDWKRIGAQYRPRKTQCDARESIINDYAAKFAGTAALADEMGWPKASKVISQVKVGGAIVDVMIKHVDGSITIIEVKRAGLGLRDYCCGIGQLMYQVQAATLEFRTLNVRAVLALPGAPSFHLILAAMRANVEILPLPTAREWKSSMEYACGAANGY